MSGYAGYLGTRCSRKGNPKCFLVVVVLIVAVSILLRIFFVLFLVASLKGNSSPFEKKSREGKGLRGTEKPEPALICFDTVESPLAFEFCLPFSPVSSIASHLWWLCPLCCVRPPRTLLSTFLVACAALSSRLPQLEISSVIK